MTARKRIPSPAPKEEKPMSAAHDPVLEFTEVDRPLSTRGRWFVDPYADKLIKIVDSPTRAFRVKLPLAKMEKWRMSTRHVTETHQDIKLRSRKVEEDAAAGTVTLLVWTERVKEGAK